MCTYLYTFYTFTNTGVNQGGELYLLLFNPATKEELKKTKSAQGGLNIGKKNPGTC